MADDKRGREKQAADEERRQRERALEEALERADEPEPEPTETPDTEASDLEREEVSGGDGNGHRECHRRGCSEPAAFVVRERYLEETGHGAVVAEAYLCRDHANEESPTNLDPNYPEYVFVVEPIAEETAVSEK